MKKFALAVAILCCVAGEATAQCCGDCDGNGVVSINELITAVNRALGSCADPTPTTQPPATRTPLPTSTATPANRCPSTFEDNNGICVFSGRYNQGCGAELTSVFSSNGTTVLVEIDTGLQQPPTVHFIAAVDDADTAALTGWSSDGLQTIHPTAGQLQLAGGRQQLVIFPNDSPFMIQGCNFVRYAGDYLGVSRAAAKAAEFDRAADWRARTIPELAE